MASGADAARAGAAEGDDAIDYATGLPPLVGAAEAVATAMPSGGELLSRWQQDVTQWPGPALLADEAQRVVVVNEAAAQIGVAAGMPFGAALAVLTEHLDRRGRSRRSAIPLRVLPVVCDDFSGWFVDAAGALPLEAGADRAISQRLADSNLRLQAEIRRRRTLERQLLSVAEQEKRRLSLELHDGLGQHLAGVAFVVRSLADAVHAGKAPEAGEIDWLQRLINEAVSRTRSLARGLWPASLERGSLGDSIRRFAEDLESIYGISCAVVIDDEPQLASPTAGYHIFRIVQEASNNAIKHGRARRLEFRIERLGDELEISVLNDGVTPDFEQLNAARGIGVAGMRLRADAIGGSLSIEPLPAGGAEVSLRLPAAPAAAGTNSNRENDA
jgi:signal transduction histidine kinase